MKAYTDYPFRLLGDLEYKEAPMREIEVLSYDGDKYCNIVVNGILTEIKLGYIYKTPKRYKYYKRAIENVFDPNLLKGETN